MIKDINLVNKTLVDFKTICNDKNTGKINIKNVIHIEKLLKNLPTYKDIDLKDYNKYTEVDDILDVNIELIKNNLNGWKKTMFEVVDFIDKNEFLLQDIYVYEEVFLKKYSNNHTIKDSIRRNLQELRDLGLIKFLGNGKYKKLWSSKR